MKPSLDFGGTRPRGNPAVFFSFLILGTVSLYNLLNTFILPPDILIGLIAFAFLIAVTVIKNRNEG